MTRSQPDHGSKDEADGTNMGVHSLSVAGHTLPQCLCGGGEEQGCGLHLNGSQRKPPGKMPQKWARAADGPGGKQ